MSPWDEARSVLNLICDEIDAAEQAVLLELNDAAQTRNQPHIDQVKVFHHDLVDLHERAARLQQRAAEYEKAVPA